MKFHLWVLLVIGVSAYSLAEGKHDASPNGVVNLRQQTAAPAAEPARDPVPELLSEERRALIETYANKVYAKWDRYWSDPLSDDGLKAMKEATKLDVDEFKAMHTAGLVAEDDIQKAINSTQRFEHLPDDEGGRRFSFTTPNGKNLTYRFNRKGELYQLSEIELNFESAWKAK